MRKPSRKMPPMVTEEYRANWIQKAIGIALLSGISSGFVYLIIEFPFTLPCLIVLWAWEKIANKKHKKKLEQIAIERTNDSICTFARSFNYRQMDTWIIRAVYEQLQKEIEDIFGLANFPIRKEDSLNLFNLDEDIEDGWEQIARRINRSNDWQDIKNNPMCGEVKTIEDFVLFISYQPKIG